MVFSIAIIGRYGVGKSLLCQYFKQHNVSVISLDTILLEIVAKRKNAQLWTASIHHHYDEISEIIPIFSEHKALTSLIEYIKKASKQYERSIVVLPSFLELSAILKNNIFNHIIAVDCDEFYQKKYLQQKGMPESVIQYYISSGYDRSYYTEFATDILLNTVKLEHIEWTVTQMLQSYILMN